MKRPFLLLGMPLGSLFLLGICFVLFGSRPTVQLSSTLAEWQNILGVTTSEAPPSSNLPQLKGETTQVTVTRVVDGDTIEISTGQKLRYIGIDTPELHHPQKGKECFGQEAKEYNQKLVEGKTIQLEKDKSETDKYGRLLRYVWVDGELVNQKLVVDGYAFAKNYPPDDAYRTQFQLSEASASAQRKGLWGACPNLILN